MTTGAHPQYGERAQEHDDRAEQKYFAVSRDLCLQLDKRDSLSDDVGVGTTNDAVLRDGKHVARPSACSEGDLTSGSEIGDSYRWHFLPPFLHAWALTLVVPDHVIRLYTVPSVVLERMVFSAATAVT